MPVSIRPISSDDTLDESNADADLFARLTTEASEIRRRAPHARPQKKEKRRPVARAPRRTPYLRLVEERYAERAHAEVQYIARTRSAVASARYFFPHACVDLTIALGECPDLHRREQLVARRDRFVTELLGHAMDRGIITPAAFFAAAGTVAVRSRLNEMRDRVEADGLMKAAQLTAAIEAAGVPHEIMCFLHSIDMIEIDAVTWGVDTTADRIVHAVAQLDPDLVEYVGMEASLIFGAPDTIDGFEQREKARRERVEPRSQRSEGVVSR